MHTTSKPYEMLILYEIFDGEKCTLSACRNDDHVIVRTPKETHIFSFDKEESSAEEKKTASADCQTRF